MWNNVPGMIEATYSEFRAHLAALLARVADDHETIRVRRQGGRPAAIVVDAEQYANLVEIAHLFSSPTSARHLLASVADADAGNVTTYDSIEAFMADVWPNASTP
jgi:prevent-host-death family protein